MRGVATTTDGRLVLTTSAGYEIFDLFTVAALERGPVTGNSPSSFGAIACMTPVPHFFGNCEGKANGMYCSGSFVAIAYECREGNHVFTYYCGEGRACEAGEDGRVLVANGEIDCAPPVRVDDSCTGQPNGTYCSVTGQAVTNPDGSPVCIVNGG